MAFVKGQSGNPSGRPKEDLGLRELARERTKEAIETLVEIMQDKDCPPSARVTASVALLDRGYGKPAQYIEATGKDGSPLIPSEPMEVARTVAFLLNRASETQEVTH